MRQEVFAPGEAPPGVADILIADRQIWRLLVKACKRGIQPRNGVLPMEQQLGKLLESYKVQSLLQCRHRGTGARTTAAAIEEALGAPRQDRRRANSGADAATKATRREDNLKKQVANLKKKLDAKKGNTAPTAPAPKAKGGKNRKQTSEDAPPRKQKRFIAMPKPLIGLEPCDVNGEPYCFDCNMKGCNEAKWGQKCDKGWHYCMAPGCNKKHSYVGNH